ncbi:MAG: PAS domain-containing sensor histidine kinase [Anaerolineae bacterium]
MQPARYRGRKTCGELAEERNCHTLIDAVPDFIYAKDKQHRFILTNRAHADARGLSSPAGMMGKTDRDFFPPHLADEFFAEEQKLLLNGVPLLNHEQTSLGYVGGSNWVITNKVPLKNIEGEIIGLVGITRDISDRKLAEEALLESEQRFRNAVLHAPFPIMIHTEDGEVLHISDMWTEITGYTQAEIPTIRDWAERAYDRGKEDVTALIKKIMAPAEVVKAGEFEIHTKAGEKHIWDFVAAPVGHIADGRRIISTMAVDITDRKRAEDALRASEQRFYQVAENFDQVLYLQTVEDARLLYVNPRIETLAPIARDSFYIGENVLMSLFHPDDVQMLMQKLGTREYIEEDSIDVELRLLQSTHQLRWVRLRTFPIRDEHGVMQLRAGTLEDITERKAAQDALLKAFDKEKELNELKTRFVSMASHEFRTPLAGILATVETLKAYRHRMTNEQIDLKFDNINNRIDHLTMLTNDVLQLTRMQSKRITVNMAPLQLDAQCRILLDEFQARPDLKHELVYTCNDPARWITLDSKLIQQILTNLISNAIKYSPDADTVFIDLHYTDTQVTITVRDIGIGIPEADFKHLFEPFHRAGNVGAIAGTGLGLVITKEAVEVQGGTITVESEVGQGTTFFITFPTQSQGVAHDEEDPRN